MLLASLLAAAVGIGSSPKTWYGPQEVVFNVQYAGNPYDPAQNDVKVRFVNERRTAVERTAYFAHGAWRAVLVAPEPGRYVPTLIRNGKSSLEEGVPSVVLLDQKLPHGFIQRDDNHTNRFQFDDGTPFYPFGFNLGWQMPDLPDMKVLLKKMGDAGLSWTRIWSDSWDGKNPWWPTGDPYALKGQLWEKALDKWDGLLKSARDSHLNVQFVLFNHGAFSSTTDANWADNPWNVAKGGFLKNATDFFTDPEAMRRATMWVRYAVARWGAMDDVFAWELFNEVEWTDAAKGGKGDAIAAWHSEMADTIRSLDPYGHLVTTSSAMDRAGLWKSMDFYGPHVYGADVDRRIAELAPPSDKPCLIGEFGPASDLGVKERALVRESIWRSILRNDAGAAMYWFWDRVDKGDMYGEFKAWASALAASDIAAHALAKRTAIKASSGTAQGLRELGWLLVRLRGAKGETRLSWPGYASGDWKAVAVDLDTGDVSRPRLIAGAGEIVFPTQDSTDVVLVLSLVS